MRGLKEPTTGFEVRLDNRKVFLLVFLALALAVLAFAVGYVVGRRAGWVTAGEGGVAVVEPPAAPVSAAATPTMPPVGGQPAGVATPALPDVPAIPATAPAAPTAAPTAPPAPRREMPTPPPVRKGWSVQVGAYSTRAQALTAAEQLKEKGRPAFVVDPAPGETRRLWRVKVGPYPTKAAAESAAASLKSYGVKEPMVREE